MNSSSFTSALSCRPLLGVEQRRLQRLRAVKIGIEAAVEQVDGLELDGEAFPRSRAPAAPGRPTRRSRARPASSASTPSRAHRAPRPGRPARAASSGAPPASPRRRSRGSPAPAACGCATAAGASFAQSWEELGKPWSSVIVGPLPARARTPCGRAPRAPARPAPLPPTTARCRPRAHYPAREE